MTLDRHRAELAALDRELVELVARRQRIASEIGREKRALGRPTRDFRQETEVLERAGEHARELGASEPLVRELLRRLIRSSLAVQERDRVVATRSGRGRRALVIGGAGKMGRWFVRFLDSQGYDVEVADPAGSIDGHVHVEAWETTDLRHDVVVVAAPLGRTDALLHALADRRPPGLVLEVASLKSPLRAGLTALREAGVRVASLHPMFGPDTDLLSGRHVVFVDVGVPEAHAAARELFASTMAEAVDMDLEEHDRLIAYVLGLSHALNLAFVSALADSGETAPKLAELSSTTFDRQLRAAAQVVAESPELYFDIQSLNDYGTESLAALLYAVERLRSVVRAGDRAGFVALMERGRDYLATSGTRGDG